MYDLDPCLTGALTATSYASQISHYIEDRRRQSYLSFSGRDTKNSVKPEQTGVSSLVSAPGTSGLAKTNH